MNLKFKKMKVKWKLWEKEGRKGKMAVISRD